MCLRALDALDKKNHIRKNYGKVIWWRAPERERALAHTIDINDVGGRGGWMTISKNNIRFLSRSKQQQLQRQ